LLEKTINASISNNPFVEKKEGYLQSQFLLTKSLINKPKVGVNTQLNRAVDELIQFEEWNSETIELRQQMLVDLARKVWEIPT
jgi:methionine aminopeptidase